MCKSLKWKKLSIQQNKWKYFIFTSMYQRRSKVWERDFIRHWETKLTLVYGVQGYSFTLFCLSLWVPSHPHRGDPSWCRVTTIIYHMSRIDFNPTGMTRCLHSVPTIWLLPSSLSSLDLPKWSKHVNFSFLPFSQRQHCQETEKKKKILLKTVWKVCDCRNLLKRTKMAQLFFF